MNDTPEAIDSARAEHYTWGGVCDGWRLLTAPNLSVIQERVPPGAAEMGHVHSQARQFFYVLSGVATVEFESRAVVCSQGQGVHVPPGMPHRFANHSGEDVVFLVISTPPTQGDRTDIPSFTAVHT